MTANWNRVAMSAPAQAKPNSTNTAARAIACVASLESIPATSVTTSPKPIA